VSAEVDPAALQLPRGRHGLTRDTVVAQQRRRMIEAVAPVLGRKGYVAMTVEDIATQAGVSRRTFYENFADKDDCFLAAYREAADGLIAAVTAATAEATSWEERLRWALRTTLHFFATHVDVAHLAVIDVLGAGPTALAARDDALLRLATAVQAEQPLLTAEQSPPLLLLQMVAGAVSQSLYAEVLNGRAGELEQLLPMLTYLMIVPMYGPAEAARRAGISGPEGPR
jgi:AcrR family transcriptional regulator